VIIAVCTLVFFLDAWLPKQFVQSGPWRAAPTVRARIQAIDALTPAADREIERLIAAGNSARAEQLRAERAQAQTERLQLLRIEEEAETAWMTRLAHRDFVPTFVRRADGDFLVALDPKLGASVDPLAVASADSVGPIRKWLQFTTAQALWVPARWGLAQGLEVWRFVGYGLLHVNFTHLFFNMAGLLVFGPIVEAAFGRLRFFAVFLLAVVIGALTYFILNVLGLVVLGASGGEFVVPGLLFNNAYLPLIGASGGVYGVILAAAWLRPEEDIMLFFFFPIPIRYFALALIGIAVLALLQNGHNAGGEAAHLGGAIAGWWIAQRPHLLDDFFPVFQRFSGTRVPRPRPRGAAGNADDIAEIDRILDKVRDNGLASLSERERNTLRNATDERRKRDGQ
jgi:membrane associated rhomboid family serine protease